VGYKLFRNGRLCESKDGRAAISNEKGELKIVVPLQGTGGTFTIWEELMGAVERQYTTTFEIRYKTKTLLTIDPSMVWECKVKIDCICFDDFDEDS
jgi:hypothetical protein